MEQHNIQTGYKKKMDKQTNNKTTKIYKIKAYSINYFISTLGIYCINIKKIL